MALPRNVVFDVGNVLLAWDPHKLAADHVEDPQLRPTVVADIFGHPDWQLLDCGQLEEQEANQRFAERSGLPVAEVERLIEASKSHLTLMDEGLTLLKAVKDGGAHVFCLTNMSRATYDYVRQKFSFWEHFEGIVVSAHVSMIKPHQDIYLHLLELYGLQADETAFMDDNPANIAGARSVGIRAQIFAPGTHDWLLAGAPQED